MLGIDTVGDLNDCICSGDIDDMVLVQEALQERRISEIAKDAHWISEEKKKIPGLVLQARKREERNDGTLPYEQMKLDQIIYGKICFGGTKEYGEVEINTEREKVLISVQGSDNGKPFTAYDAISRSL